ncbi:MAG: alpha-L-fucosidase [Limisphaerales bacterium]
MKRLTFIICLAALLALAQVRSSAADPKINPGKYSGTMNSLTNYSCPEWFRDAKFGIWANWGPQAVPMEGDWYARRMYQRVCFGGLIPGRPVGFPL